MECKNPPLLTKLNLRNQLAPVCVSSDFRAYSVILDSHAAKPIEEFGPFEEGGGNRKVEGTEKTYPGNILGTNPATPFLRSKEIQ